MSTKRHFIIISSKTCTTITCITLNNNNHLNNNHSIVFVFYTFFLLTHPRQSIEINQEITIHFHSSLKKSNKFHYNNNKQPLLLLSSCSTVSCLGTPRTHLAHHLGAERESTFSTYDTSRQFVAVSPVRQLYDSWKQRQIQTRIY